MGAAPPHSCFLLGVRAIKSFVGHIVTIFSDSNMVETPKQQIENIFNQQFQSVFTPLAPLSLQELSLMKVQDLVDDKVISPGALPEDLRNSTPLMPDIEISEAGILNLLKNLIPKKAAGPDRIKPVILQELRVELAPIIKVLFERSLESGAVPLIWKCLAYIQEGG